VLFKRKFQKIKYEIYDEQILKNRFILLYLKTNEYPIDIHSVIDTKFLN